MRLNRLAADLTTQRGANTQAVATNWMRGEQGADGRLGWENKLETAFGNGMAQIKKRPNNLAELKRLVKKSGGNVCGWAGILGTFSR